MMRIASAASLKANTPHLQVPPAFARPGVMLYPGLDPVHNSNDLNHSSLTHLENSTIVKKAIKVSMKSPKAGKRPAKITTSSCN